MEGGGSVIECPLAPEILARFLSPDIPRFAKPIHLRVLKGDYTQAWEDRTRLHLGEEAYSHLHTDTMVTNGSVCLLFRSYRHPEGQRRSDVSIPPEWMWCANHVRDGQYCEPADDYLMLISEATRELVKFLPCLKFWEVQPFPVYSIGKKSRKLRELQKPPEEIAFFSFDGGVGFCGAGPRPGKRALRKSDAAHPALRDEGCVPTSGKGVVAC